MVEAKRSVLLYTHLFPRLQGLQLGSLKSTVEEYLYHENQHISAFLFPRKLVYPSTPLIKGTHYLQKNPSIYFG